VVRDVILPALAPALIASGAIAFATAMGAFGTAFTLATDVAVLPMLIYTEFTLSANIALAAALSVGLGPCDLGDSGAGPQLWRHQHCRCGMIGCAMIA
jgi:ABC-type sulfate transport system permease component